MEYLRAQQRAHEGTDVRCPLALAQSGLHTTEPLFQQELVDPQSELQVSKREGPGVMGHFPGYCGGGESLMDKLVAQQSVAEPGKQLRW